MRPTRKKHEREHSRPRRPARPDAARARRRLGRFWRRRRALAQQIGAHRLSDVLEALGPEVGCLKLERRLDLPVGVFGQANPTRLANPFQPGGDVHTVAHEIAVTLLDDVAKMNADAKLDPTFRRKAGAALDHARLHLEGAAHGVDHAAELDDDPVAGALDDAAMMGGYCRIEEIAAETPPARECSGPRLRSRAGCSRRHPRPKSPQAFASRSSRRLSGRRKIGAKNYRPNRRLLLGTEKVNTDRIGALERPLPGRNRASRAFFL